MSLSNALQIGRSGLLANQAAIEVAGNNLSNVGTPGYHRQSISLSPVSGQEIQRGIFIGRGVQIQAITRQVSDALEGRLRNGVADEAASSVRQDLLKQVESLQNELSGNDISSALDAFFNSWSELANSPGDNSVRTVVLQQGQSLASLVRNIRTSLSGVREGLDTALDQAAQSANDLLTRIEQVNLQIAKANGSTKGANSLYDQRDQLLQELSQYMDISTVEQPSGAVDVYVGSTPIVLNGRNRGIELRKRSVNGELSIDVVLRDDKSELSPSSGKIGALIDARRGDIEDALTGLDDFANHLAYQVNRVHSQGQSAEAVTAVTGQTRTLDATKALNDPDAGIKFPVTHGSFQVHVTQISTGQRVTSTVNVDLDNVNTAGNTSLTSLAASIDGIANLGASVTADGRLRINTDSNDFKITFSDDSSGALAALGINTFFSGDSAATLAVNPTVAGRPAALAAGAGNVPGDNRTALAIAGLRTQRLDALGGLNLTESWSRHVEDFAVRTAQAASRHDADAVVKSSLEAQREEVSGVNTDEEAINLLAYQRAYQGSARFLSVVDEMYKTLTELL